MSTWLAWSWRKGRSLTEEETAKVEARLKEIREEERKITARASKKAKAK